MPVPDWVQSLLHEAQLTADDAAPMAGGVSSDVWRVRLHDGTAVVVKRAVEQLRVSTPWRAPLARNIFEAGYLRRVGTLVPGFVPTVVASSRRLHAFAMADLNVRDNWKDALLSGHIDPAVAAEFGTRLARVHAETAGDASLATEFDTGPLFEALRLEPYLRYTASQHSEQWHVLEALADELAGSRIALVHGDVSPKNILVTGDGPMLIDAECAWYGDPAFDLAFLLNHLVLKQFRAPQHAMPLQQARRVLLDQYLTAVRWEPAAGIAQRIARLIPALMLARVDGRSPVEYLDTAQRDSVRTTAITLLDQPETDLSLIEELIPT